MASESKKGRLERLKKATAQYPRTRYRKALPTLLRETGQRCGYSLQHILDLGRTAMEVDHIDPTLRHPFRNRHGNLIAASRHCNNRKSQSWSSPQDRELGLYIINPYAELDYGPHIVEDRATGMLRGNTVTGRWHIEQLDLNAEHLVIKRRDRTKLRAACVQSALMTGVLGARGGDLDALLKQVSSDMSVRMIPELPEW